MKIGALDWSTGAPAATALAAGADISLVNRQPRRWAYCDRRQLAKRPSGATAG
jgi:hypothetical protein